MSEKIPGYKLAYENPIEQLIHTTVRIECETAAGTSVGSGFFFDFCEKDGRNIPCIVTNKHVISGALNGTFRLTLKNSDGKPQLGKFGQLVFNNFEHMWIKHPEEDVDLAIFPIAPLIQNAKKENKEFYFRSLNRNHLGTEIKLSSMEEIIMIGYPIGLWDSTHNLPIIRRGVTATHPRLPYNGNAEFFIDAACFPGSSGSPVFLANIGSFLDENGSLNAGTRIALLGILYGGPQYTVNGKIEIVTVPTKNEPLAKVQIPTNLGLAIQASKLLDFEPILEEKVAAENATVQ